MFKKYLFTLLFLIPLCSFSQKQMPSIKLQDLNQTSIDVYEDFAEEDKIYIFSFWATWCAPCINELQAIHDNYDEWKNELNIEVIAISVDDSRTKKRINPMVNGKGWEYKILLDTNQELKRALSIANVPYMVIVKNKQIVSVHNGYSEGFEEELFNELKAL